MKEALSRFKDTVKGEIRKALKVLRNDDDMEEVNASKKDLANQEKTPVLNIIIVLCLCMLVLLACGAAKQYPGSHLHLALFHSLDLHAMNFC